jgi:DNA gyrase/topoisomerase IV subunit A
MRLQRLTGLEQDKIIGEYKEVMAQIADLLDILAKPERVTAIISGELTALKQEFGQTKLAARRSVIERNALELGTEDLITPADMVVTLSHTGYIKSQPLSEYRAQSAAAAASRPRRPRKTTGSTSSSSPTRTTGSCASATAAASTGSRSGKCRKARATRAASPSSTCSRCSRARRSPWCCR